MGASYTLGRLAEALGATLAGDPERLVTGVAPLDKAGPEHVSFLVNPRYLRAAVQSAAGAVVVDRGVEGLPQALLRVDSAQTALIPLLRCFYPEAPVQPGVHPAAIVAVDARLDPTASVGAGAVVEAGAVIGARSRIGALCFVGAGAVLGADGFGYAFDGHAHRKIPPVGGLRIEDDVEIGANTTIDRATLGHTLIGRGSKIDNLVQVGHNSEVGEDVILVSQVGISGSCKIGHRAVLAGQVGIADHVTVAAGAVVTAQSGVPSDIETGGVWSGTPSRPSMDTRRIWAAETLLPELVRKVRALEKRVRELEGQARD